MPPFLARRTLALLPVIFGVVTVTFALIHVVPGDPVVAMLGENASPTDIEGMRHQLSLDRPILVQYTIYLGNLVRGDLGFSISNQVPVSRLIADRYPALLDLPCVALSGATSLPIPLRLFPL